MKFAGNASKDLKVMHITPIQGIYSSPSGKMKNSTPSSKEPLLVAALSSHSQISHQEILQRSVKILVYHPF
ncbi:hypothetical protein Leryth_024266 [Lithospermum erythrorhizon]|nr:hypothetical protein Leryth_024266 [Lithospermum erythrorhizon]